MNDVLIALLSVMGITLGASLASFTSLILDRRTRSMSFVHPRSACTNCGALVAWRDNVPVLSFLALRGRCRSCGASIPKHILFLETIGACAGGALAFAWLQHVG